MTLIFKLKADDLKNWRQMKHSSSLRSPAKRQQASLAFWDVRSKIHENFELIFPVFLILLVSYWYLAILFFWHWYGMWYAKVVSGHFDSYHLSGL